MVLPPQAPVSDWTNQTHLHWLGLVLTLGLGYGALVLPRSWVPLLLLTLACFVAPGQRLVLLTLDFDALRLLVLFTWLRVVVRREWKSLRFQPLDVVFLGWVLTGLMAYSIRSGTQSALVFKLGSTFDAVGLYFLFRCLIVSWNDLGRVASGLALLSVPVCAAFWIEHLTGRNLFSVFGGVPEFTLVREGRLRCQGAFAHSILAGCFWAASLPLIAACWWKGGRGRWIALIGSTCAVMIVVLCASSTPIFAAGVAILGALAFEFRRFLRVGRLAALVSLVILQLVLKGPVWSLVARVDVVGGSTGWHRFYLIDETIRHFDEWWMLGTASTAHWGRGLTDLTNQYVVEATQGGLPQLLLFLLLIGLGFRAVGRAWRSAWPNRAEVALSWALGVSLFTQVVSFIGVAYFGQIWILWFLVLACLGSCGSFAATHDASSGSALPQEDKRRLPRATAAVKASALEGVSRSAL